MTTELAERADAGQTAGALLRAARQRQGMHIGALAALVKVPAAKLEALEADRYDALPDTAFTRALAKTLCRVLKTDPEPVLTRLPGALSSGLDRVDGGLNTPFHDRPGNGDPAQWVPWRKPVPWAVAALLVAAAAFVLVPMRVDMPAEASTAVLPPASPEGQTTAVPAATAVPPVTSAASATAAPMVLDPPAVSGAAASGALTTGNLTAAAPPAAETAVPVVPPVGDDNKAQLRAVKDTWVQATDGRGQVLTARVIPAGETVEFSGVLPLRLRIGNIAGAELSFRGLPVDLNAGGGKRDNTASITLQ